MKTKQCSKCKEVKYIDEFYNHPKNKDGKDTQCKICARGYANKHLSDNREQINEKRRDRYKNDPLPITLSNKLWKQNNKEKVKETKKRWAQNNKEKVRNYMNNRKNKNPARAKELHNKYAKISYHKFPHKAIARRAVRDAIFSGTMPPVKSLKCSYCGNQARHYHHHHGYEESHWLDVIPVCIPCHNSIHVKTQ